ncbi:MAG: hypothetical protein COW00_04280 [Bdellovibrio sp. CG12_big_fil_rev_8_21_14_0_65_39_13]|nr:MAG: hypothetical protein COW78_16815 [Bdellovibrio sp. CG22_combo_CG10-13_8_21_14_all_39_27]PIQ61285.1 MAG: hypothetical protein COW00_04280 [Bdellovibrio sp. CG12_big_fil_rev_8_21_14_0_65_39_13]PIR36716.1 MAG: hypothetical protein COV37_01830 [Bdellovibrio sp. CG11_big_fil_rev_8_21_14_0_20_39_38]
MSKNTMLRIISAAILLAILVLCIYFGRIPTLSFVFVAGILIQYEIFKNFLKFKPFGFISIISMVMFTLVFWFNAKGTTSFQNTILALGLVVDILFIIYLFATKIDSTVVKDHWIKFPLSLPFLLTIFISCVGQLINLPNWKLLIGLVLFVNFGMDTGAWLIGKNFGKHKLWKSVSPSKTLEGLLGGVLFSSVLGTLYWKQFLGETSWAMSLIFGLLGVFSQVGDLVQSKVKRQFAIKDSSSLIPGHGGVYDRVDSLMFVTPMFLVMYKYFYF